MLCLWVKVGKSNVYIQADNTTKNKSNKSFAAVFLAVLKETVCILGNTLVCFLAELDETIDTFIPEH